MLEYYILILCNWLFLKKILKNYLSICRPVRAIKKDQLKKSSYQKVDQFFEFLKGQIKIWYQFATIFSTGNIRLYLQLVPGIEEKSNYSNFCFNENKHEHYVAYTVEKYNILS